MKIIAIGTLKGGTGKTTMCFNLAGVLAKKHRVLLIDVDPQCNLSSDVGIDISNRDNYSSKDIFEDKVSPSAIVVKQPIPELPNLDIIPSSITLISTELHISSRTARERILHYYIQDNKDYFSKYDYILIDTNPSMGIINQNAFFTSDSIILVADVDKNSLTGLELFSYLWEEICHDLHKKNNIAALIINKVDVRTNLTSDIKEYCLEHDELGPILVPQTVRAKIAYTKAALACKPINVFAPSSTEEAEINAVIDYLKEKGVF